MHVLRWLGCAALLFGLGSCRSASRSNVEPSEPHFTVNAGDVRILARSSGGGSVLVVINGGPGASHHSIARLEALASPSLRVVLYDQRGMGGSSAPVDEKGYGLDQYVADLDALRANIGVSKIHLLGHSFGGLVAMAYAASHAEHVESLTLVSSRAPDWDDQKIAMASFEKRFAKLLAEKKIPENPPPAVGDDCREQSSAFLPVLFADPDFKGAMDETKTTSCSIRVRNATEALLPGYDLRPKLKAFTGLALVMIGDADPFGEEMGRATAKALQGASVQFEVFPKCGHFPWVECPDAFRPKLDAFLAKATRHERASWKRADAGDAVEEPSSIGNDATIRGSTADGSTANDAAGSDPTPNDPNGTLAERLQIAGLEVAETTAFLRKLQELVAQDNRPGVCALVSYPLIVPTLATKEKIKNEASCVRAFEPIFTDKVRHAIAKQRVDALFANSRGVMIANGDVWFSGICSDNHCSQKTIKIITVNN